MDARSKKLNDKLRYQRESKGWSQRKLAQLLGTSEGMISRWECGERKPNRYYQERLCRLFDKSADELGLIDAFSSYSNPTVDLQTFEQHINDRLDTFESVLNLSWETWFASRPRMAAHEISRLLPQLEKMIYVSPSIYTLRIKELVTRSHALLGAICLDALQNDAALYHYMQAHKYAEELRDVSLEATYLALIGDVLRRQNKKLSAVGHMEVAESLVHGDKATHGHILQLLAYTYADMGNEAAFIAAIQQAIDLLGFSGEGRDSSRKEFIPFEVFEICGKARRDLGKPLDALPYLDRAQEALQVSDAIMPRWMALLNISRGQALCDIGDLSTGVELTSQGFLLAYQCHSLRQMNRVRKLLRKLESDASPYKADKQVANLKELVRDTYLRVEP